MTILKAVKIIGISIILLIVVIPAALYLALVWHKLAYDFDRTWNSACYVDDNLRIQIGGTVFSFPRSEIRYSTKKELSKSGDVELVTLEDPENICQKKNDLPLVLHSIGLKPNIQPIICTGECLTEVRHRSRLLGSIISTENRKVKIEQKQHIKKCIERPYFDTCKYALEYKNVTFGFQYYLSGFPLEKIEQTEALVVKYLKDHDITPVRKEK